MFSLEKSKNNVPVVIVRGDSPLDGEIIYMKTNRDEEDEKPCRRRKVQTKMSSTGTVAGSTKEKKKKGGRVRFANYDEFGEDDNQAESEDDNQAEGVDSFTLDRGKFELLPNTEERQRHNIYVCGRSGSGKSTWTRNYIKNYLKMKKGNQVYIFSALDTDPAFDDLKCNRILLDEDIVNNPIEPAELRDSLCVFDDIDIISDPKVKKAVIELQDKCLEIGRHSNIDMVNTAHKICDYRRSRTLLNEASHIVIFPARGNNLTKYFLDKYSGLDKRNVQRIYNNKSRWSCLQINHPGFILTEKELYLPE
jgi:hypothetical protein